MTIPRNRSILQNFGKGAWFRGEKIAAYKKMIQEKWQSGEKGDTELFHYYIKGGASIIRRVGGSEKGIGRWN